MFSSICFQALGWLRRSDSEALPSRVSMSSRLSIGGSSAS